MVHWLQSSYIQSRMEYLMTGQAMSSLFQWYVFSLPYAYNGGHVTAGQTLSASSSHFTVSLISPLAGLEKSHRYHRFLLHFYSFLARVYDGCENIEYYLCDLFITIVLCKKLQYSGK